MVTYLSEHSRGKDISLSQADKQHKPYDVKAGTEEVIISRNDDATNFTFSAFCFRSSSSPPFPGSRLYPWPGGIEVMVLINGMMRLLR